MFNKTRGPAPGYAKHPQYLLSVRPAGATVRVSLNGEVVAESAAALLVSEESHPPRYYLPPADVAMNALRPTAHRTYCPYKGDASYWTVRAGDKIIENGAWAYQEPFDEFAELAGLVSFYGERMQIELVCAAEGPS